MYNIVKGPKPLTRVINNNRENQPQVILKNTGKEFSKANKRHESLAHV